MGALALNRSTASLVTGFPAFRARNVLHELTRRHPEVEVVALVHPSRAAEARAAADELGLSDGSVTLVEGDPAAIDFGLSGADYLALAARVRVVHGAYSVTDPDLTDGVETLNVGAARELVEFARAASGLERLVLYSSVFVSGDRTGRVPEDELEAGQGFRNPTERSLAIAERLVRNSGLPFNVLRCGHLLGASDDGSIDRPSGPYLCAGILLSAPADTALPLPPFAEARLPVTPVDYLAELGASATELFAAGTTMHAIDPRPLTLGGFVRLLAEALGRDLDPGFSAGAMTRALLGNPVAKLLPKNRRGLLEILTTGGDYDTERAAELPSRGGPECPPLGEYLGKVIEHVRKRVDGGSLYPKLREEPAFLVA